MEKLEPRDPHWYLAMIGVDPSLQGRGIGAQLMQPVLDEADRDGLLAYLESSNPLNVPWYEKFGFHVTGELPLAKDGPVLHLMTREPQVPRPN
jgi:ribosomal protein S18 acetylase RimI-like enzyme